MAKTGYVYILTNQYDRVFYTGVTSNLSKRINEHLSKLVPGFTQKYKCTKLVFYENCGDIEHAIIREKQIKGGSRRRKIALIESVNPNWKDLSNGIYP